MKVKILEHFLSNYSKKLYAVDLFCLKKEITFIIIRAFSFRLMKNLFFSRSNKHYTEETKVCLKDFVVIF